MVTKNFLAFSQENTSSLSALDKDLSEYIKIMKAKIDLDLENVGIKHAVGYKHLYEKGYIIL